PSPGEDRLKPNDPRFPDSPPSATPPPVDQPVDEEGGQRAPFSISDGGDFSTPHRRRRTITRPRGLRAIDSPSPDLIDPGAEAGADEVGVDGATPPPQAELDLPSGVEALAASPQPVSPMSAVDEFLASPPTPVPELAAPAPSASNAELASADTRALGPTGPASARRAGCGGGS